jgi:membrane protein YqaA with SNARE-associated domain
MKISTEIKFLLSLSVIVAIFAFAFWLSEAAVDNMYVQEIISRYGYFGIFAAAVISGFNLVVPIPAVTFVPALVESGLNYWLCVIILALGMTAADLVAYILGRAGRGAFSEALNQRLIKRLDKLKDKHPTFPLGFIFLFASVVPVPNEILLVPLGFLRYRMVSVMIAIFFGNLVFNAIYSKGLTALFGIFN